jgi:hypothetical protein
LINLNENYEIEYWTKELSVSREKLKEAVAAAGTSAAAVREYSTNKDGRGGYA